MSDFYSLSMFDEAYKKIISFAVENDLDLDQCAFNVSKGSDGSLTFFCFDNVSQKPFGTSLNKDAVLRPNWNLNKKELTNETR